MQNLKTRSSQHVQSDLNEIDNAVQLQEETSERASAPCISPFSDPQYLGDLAFRNRNRNPHRNRNLMSRIFDHEKLEV